MQVESRVAGIPCLIEVTHYFNEPGSASACNPWDYYGYTEIEFNVLDRRGRRAEWLERKLTRKDEERIENEIIDAINND